jgi:very-short-patch-repair endonuclease
LQNTAFTNATARQAQISAHRLRSNDLANPFHGVHTASEPEQTIEWLSQALAVKLPDGAFFCGVTAARLYGMPLPRQFEIDQTVHVGVPAPGTAPTGRGIRGHSISCGPDDRCLRNGLWLTTPERTWCDLGQILLPDALVAAGDFLLNWRTPLTTRARLLDAIDRYPSRRGIRRLRMTGVLVHDRSDSPKETQLRLMLIDANLSGLEVNFSITTTGGFRYRADLAFPAKRTLIEYQSAFHESAERFRSDMTRRARLEADGWFVIEVNNDDLRAPDELTARVRRALASRQ